MLRQTNQKSNRYIRRKKPKMRQEPTFYAESRSHASQSSDATHRETIELDADSVLGLKKNDEIEKRKIANSDKKLGKLPANFFNRESEISTPAQNIISLHVMATSGLVFSGYELLQALLSAGLRYGKMNIFHRHEYKSGNGDILFSVAAANKPGTFNLQEIGNFSCPGLSLFFVINKVKDPLQVFELMLETAGNLVEGLGGHVLDNQYQKLTRETIIAIRKQLRHHEQNSRMSDLFATEYTEVASE